MSTFSGDELIMIDLILDKEEDIHPKKNKNVLYGYTICSMGKKRIRRDIFKSI